MIAFLLWPLIASVHAQVVTSSFDRTLLSTNPAASTTRGYGQMAAALRMNNSKSTIFDDSTGPTVKWKERFDTRRIETYFTGGHAKLVPEFYLSFNNGEKKLTSPDLAGQHQTTKSRMNLVNNMLNLGYRFSSTLAIGLKYYRPMFTYDEDYSFTDPSRTLSVSNKVKTAITGIGVGATYALAPSLYWGGYFTSITQVDKGSYSQTDSSTPGNNVSNQGNSDDTLGKFGFGLSYLQGSSARRGMRLELSYNRLDATKELKRYSDAKAGEQIQSALELAWRGFTFGGNLKLTRNVYYETADTLERFMTEPTLTRTFAPSYGGFLSLISEKGHSIGLSGFVSQDTGKRAFFRNQVKAKTNRVTLNFNYAYLF